MLLRLSTQSHDRLEVIGPMHEYLKIDTQKRGFIAVFWFILRSQNGSTLDIVDMPWPMYGN